MFEDSLVESTALLRTQNRWPAVLSLTAQLCVGALILVLPLLHPELLPMPHLIPATLAPPRAPAPPPPTLHVRPQLSNSIATHVLSAPSSTQPQRIFQSFLHPTGPALDNPPLPVVDLGAKNPGLPLGINSAAPAGPHVAVGPPAPTRSKLPTLSQGVTAGHLIEPIRPEYPAIARSAGIAGTVVVQAIISRTGTIESAHVISGPAMLQRAALDAVRQARYRPFLLDGQPTAVETTITIVFRMNG